EALTYIKNNPSFISMFPEVNASGMNDLQKIDFIEKTLLPAEDQRLAARMGTRMREAYGKAVDLPVVMTDEEKATAEEGLRVEKGRMDKRVNSIAGLLASKGITKPGGGAYTEKDVAGIIDKNAFAPETTSDALAEHILGQPHNEFADVKNYRVTLPGVVRGLESRLDVARKAAVPPPADINAFCLANPGNPDVILYLTSQGEMTRLQGIYEPVGAAKHASLADFDTKVYGLYQDNAFTVLSTEAKQAQQKGEELELRINARPKTTEEIKKTHDQRLLAEEDLCGELDNILGQAMADAIEERYDVMEERMERFMQDKADKSEKDVKINIMNLRKKMSENWIKYDKTTRKKTVNKDQIKTDVTHLAYAFDKDIALKQIIARDLFGVANFDRINVIDGSDMSLPPPVPPAVAPAPLLNTEQLKQLDSVFKAAGSEYRDKLFADMFAARGTFDRNLNLGFGMEISNPWNKLGFKRDEWKYMLQRYEPDVTKALEANHDAHTAMKTLEAQGVKMDVNMKWLWYILAVVFGGATGGVAGAVIPGISALQGAGAVAAAEAVATKAVINRERPDV
ncbi:MAG: hypothetical protein NTZ55_01690, partial [Candidatus Roizmanbacteria bacterium]|nr:hypothetical protein [Candidatus Roizmanbacteria bacterium]